MKCGKILVLSPVVIHYNDAFDSRALFFLTKLSAYKFHENMIEFSLHCSVIIGGKYSFSKDVLH